MSEQWLNRVEERREWILTYHALREANLYPVVVQYVAQHQEQSKKKKNLQGLTNYLDVMEVKYSLDELQLIIELELLLQRYPQFKIEMQSVPGYPLENLIGYYVDRYRSRYKKYIRLLECYAEELGYVFHTLEFEVERIRKQIDAGKFIQGLSNFSAGSVTMEWIDRMTGHEFEMFLRHFFLLMGARDAVVRKTNDFGGDIIITHPDGRTTAVQAKRSTKPVGVTAVYEAHSAVTHYRTSDGMVVTNSTFTQNAEEHAIATRIRLVNRNELSVWVQQYQQRFYQQGPGVPPTFM